MKSIWIAKSNKTVSLEFPIPNLNDSFAEKSYDWNTLWHYGCENKQWNNEWRLCPFEKKDPLSLNTGTGTRQFHIFSLEEYYFTFPTS